MTTMDFLTELRRRGVVLTLVDRRLRVRAPRRELSAADRDGLRAERDAIVALVRAEMTRPRGFLPIVRHAHVCTCGGRFKCTTPSCSGQVIQCVCCKLDAKARRHEVGGVRLVATPVDLLARRNGHRR